ncbi:MAG: exodeoxyribonuclease-3 [Cellvibrionaceae bacterium]|jgi:exodeoxyribonuclease-3
MLSVASFNVNSIRQRIHQLKALIDIHSPDIIGLQETKVSDEAFPVAEIHALGYNVSYYGQKTHYGVGLLSRQDFNSVKKGFDLNYEESQRRLIIGEFISLSGEKLTVINGYFPQGEHRDHPVKFVNKRDFYANLITHLERNHTPDDHLIVMGDMNVSPTDDDIGIGEHNRKRWLQSGKCSFLPEEREWLDRLMAWGLEDTFTINLPANDQRFSWFDYRSRGFERDPKRGLRIDLILATKPLANRTIAAGIDYDIRAMEKPSDHCPVWTQFTD